MKVTGFAEGFGNGAYNLLLGFNVIANIIVWPLCALCLLEVRSVAARAKLCAVPGTCAHALLRQPASYPTQHLSGEALHKCSVG